ncbi:MAG TPA: sigma-70 family RNA polymerase sigma factor [Bacteroidales bacterium]|nr:sigma-70 family RNA polymerase sigma factor [Bacteroidales bacterium]
MKEFTDIEIIECLRNRESYVVQYLSDRYFPLIRMMVQNGGGSNEDAHDVFQDGLIILLEKIDENKLELQCKFKTYLYSVCEHVWKGLIDKRTAASNYLNKRYEEEVEDDISEFMDNDVYHSIFRKVFDTMDDGSKEILNLYWQEVSNQEIADRLGFTYGYVRKKKCEAQNELIRKVKEHPEYKKLMIRESPVKKVLS